MYSNFIIVYFYFLSQPLILLETLVQKTHLLLSKQFFKGEIVVFRIRVGKQTYAISSM